jgi:hypothetical protein
MKTPMALLLALVALDASAGQPLDYRFDSVSRTVTVTSSGKEQRATKGTHASSGDQVETGWFSSALISSESQRARFEIYSATQVTLAEDTPGVILSLERGRIRAAFDKIVGSEPRIVKTPGALLAVRGTDFDVRVDRDGNTTVDVFEGLVEVQSPLRPEPLFVKPGEEARFGRNQPPSSRPMPEQRRREGEDARNPNGNRTHPNDGTSHDGDRGGRPGTGGMGGNPGGGHPPQPPPQKPPQKPPQPESF